MIFKASQIKDIWNYADSLGYRVEVGGYVTENGDYCITAEGNEEQGATIAHDCDKEWNKITFHSHPRWNQPEETRIHNARDFPTLPSGPDVAQLLNCNDPTGKSTNPRQENIIAEYGAISIRTNQSLVDHYNELDEKWQFSFTECVAQYVKQLQRCVEFGMIGPKSYVSLLKNFQFNDILELRETVKMDTRFSNDQLKVLLDVGDQSDFSEDEWKIFGILDGIIGVDFNILERY